MIVSYKIDGDMIRVKTDNPGRNEFVYPKGMFSSLEQLNNEINKSLSFEAKRKERKEMIFNKLKNEFSEAAIAETKEEPAPVVEEVIP